MVKALLILLYVILGILGLLLALLLLVLLVPVRYSLFGEYYGKVKFDAGVSWLFRLISVSASKGDGKAGIEASFFGIRKPIGGKKKETSEETSEEIEPEPDVENDGKESAPGFLKKNRELLSDERFLFAAERALNRTVRLLRHILPKNIEGDIRFGAEDPAVTGKVTGIVAALIPANRDRVKFTPDFSGKAAEGYLRMKGRVLLIFLCVLAIQILLDKNVRYVIKTLRAAKKDTEVENV